MPLSDFLLLLCARILLDRFRAPDTCWKTTLKALSIEPQFKLLWLGSTEPPKFKKIRLAKILQIDFKIDLMFYT